MNLIITVLFSTVKEPLLVLFLSPLSSDPASAASPGVGMSVMYTVLHTGPEEGMCAMLTATQSPQQ
jgi:hypothetical protein